MVEIFEGNEKYLAYKTMDKVTTRFNLFEFYYVILSKYGKEKADIVFKNYRNVAKEVDNSILKSAAEFKVNNHPSEMGGITGLACVA